MLVFPELTPGGPTTNVVPPGGIQWFPVRVPVNALAATNSLLFASLPVDLWFSTNVPPTITNSYDFELLTNATNGVSVLTPGTVPALVDGSLYFLGVQNTNAIAVTNVIEVTFELPPPPVFVLDITATNIGGTNGYQLSWGAPTNDQFHLQWTPSLLPQNWKNFKGVISVQSYVTATNSLFSYFDDGSQSSGFTPTRFYRLQLLNSPTNTAPFFINGTPSNVFMNFGQTLTVSNTAADYDIPTQLLSYSLQTTVTGTNPPAITGNGVISWTPDIAQTNTTNLFTTIVTDCAAQERDNTFVVVVSTNGAPSFSSVTVQTNGVNLTWMAPTNDQFNVRWTTNLVAPINWTLFTNTVTSTNGPSCLWIRTGPWR